MYNVDNESFWEFISAHSNVDASELMLKYRGSFLPFDLNDAVVQIDCRRRTATKLSTFNRCERFYYPSRIAAEQSSNEDVALFHASLINENERVADLTSGLGIDAMCIAQSAAEVHTFEMDEAKTDALVHNSRALGIENISVHPAGDSIKWLQENDEIFDVIFIDPARRDNSDRRVYGFDDCTPNVKENLNLLLSRCKRLIIKASPMLDMTQTVRDLPGLKTLLAVSWRGECKEILAIVESGYSHPCDWGAVMINSNGEINKYFPATEELSPTKLPHELIGCYLYEPDTAVLKLGNDANLTAAFPKLVQCDKHTQVYISEERFETFPGKIFKIDMCSKLNDKSLKKLKGKKMNVVCRNFPLKPQELKKRLQIKDGGEEYLYAVTIDGHHRVVHATKS